MGVEGEKISSPIRVSPDRERDPTRRGRESSSKTSNDRKLSIKDRLYVSRQTIGLDHHDHVCMIPLLCGGFVVQKRSVELLQKVKLSLL